MMFRGETRPRRPDYLPAIRALLLAIPAAVAVFWVLTWAGIGSPWAELSGAIAGGFLVGRLSRHSA